MEIILSPEEEKNKKRGWVTSVIIHIGIVILLLIPFFTYQDPPPGQDGILVNLGLPDIGEGEENAAASSTQPEVSEPEPVVENEPEPVVEEPTPPDPTPEPVKEQVTPQKEVITAEDPEQIALKKKREEEAKKKAEAAEAERKRKAAEEAERKRKAEEARKKAEEEAKKKAESDKFKNQIGDLFGDGGGKGNTGKQGNQGAENGDPNAQNLEGISTGTGTVKGFGGRGYKAPSPPQNTSQKSGTVVIKICVDKSGKVDPSSASFTLGGSSTQDATLVRIAKSHAVKYRFDSAGVDKQCGTITYVFKLK